MFLGVANNSVLCTSVQINAYIWSDLMFKCYGILTNLWSDLMLSVHSVLDFIAIEQIRFMLY